MLQTHLTQPWAYVCTYVRMRVCMFVCKVYNILAIQYIYIFIFLYIKCIIYMLYTYYCENGCEYKC